MMSQGSNSSLSQFLEWVASQPNATQDGGYQQEFDILEPEEDGCGVKFELQHYTIQDGSLPTLSSLSPYLDYPTPQDTPSPSITTSVSSAYIPSNEEFPGSHNFRLSIADITNTRNKIYYNEELNKVYLNMYEICTLQLFVSRPLPPDTFVRLMPVFSQAKYIKDVVHRCPLHARIEDPSNADFLHPLHVIRLDSATAIYEGNCTNDRLSVLVPYHSPSAGTSYTPLNFFFMCLSSCPGGINRRPLQVVVTLEYGSEVLGRRALNIRVSASPKRDYSLDLKYLQKKALKEEEYKNKHKKVTTVQVQAPPTMPPEPPEQNYVITLRNYNEYTIVTRLLECLRMCLDNTVQATQGTQTAGPNNGSKAMESIDFPYDPETSISKFLRHLKMEHCIVLFQKYKFFKLKDLKQLTMKHLAKMKLQNHEVEKVWSYVLKNSALRESSQSSASSGEGNSGNSRALDITTYSVSVNVPFPHNTTPL